MNNETKVVVTGDNPETLRTVLALQAAGLEVKTHGEGAFVIVPPNHKVESLNHLLPPTRVKQRVVLQEADSFADYVNRFKKPDTLIFAQLTETTVRLEAVIDYHSEGADSKPGRCDHRAIYEAKQTPEWEAWLKADRDPMSQVDFATWMEDNLKLFVSPPGAELLELVKSLHGHSNARFNQSIRLDNGAFSIAFDEDVQVRGGDSTTREGSIELPQTIEAGIAPFLGALKYSVKARLKTRIENRRLLLFFETMDTPGILRDTIMLMVKAVSEKTGIVPLHGSP